jgi:hypothetical protein
MTLEVRQSRIQGSETRDPVGDVRPSLPDESGQLRRAVGTVPGVAPAGDLAGVPERHVEPAKVDQQPQMLDVRVAVVAVGVVAAGGARQPAGPLVERSRLSSA